MKKYKKFEKLHEYFLKQENNTLSLTFDDIESINGHKLSTSASNHKEYWYGPDSHSLPRSWAYNGYKLKSVSLEEKIAIFEKRDSSIILRITICTTIKKLLMT